jgi:hypothetical protein
MFVSCARRRRVKFNVFCWCCFRRCSLKSLRAGTFSIHSAPGARARYRVSSAAPTSTLVCGSGVGMLVFVRSEPHFLHGKASIYAGHGWHKANQPPHQSGTAASGMFHMFDLVFSVCYVMVLPGFHENSRLDGSITFSFAVVSVSFLFSSPLSWTLIVSFLNAFVCVGERVHQVK